MKKIISSTLILSSLTLSAFEMSRTQSWEMYLGPQYGEAKTLEFGNGSSASIGSSASFMFGFAYNFDPHLNLGFMFNSTSTNYKGTIANKEDTNTKDFSASLYTSAFDLTATYHFMEGQFTPYVAANLGMTYIDSGISTGETDTGCWWYPWWGYVCGPVDSTYTANKLNYGGQLGLRYDFGEAAFFKAGIGLNHVDLDGTSDDTFTVYNFLIGFKFR